LANPDGEPDAEGNLIIAANPDDAIEDDSGTAVDPPWRTDPFQNIVNLNSARFAVYIRIIATTPVTIGSGGTCAGPGAPQRSDFDLEKYLLSFKGAYMGFDIYRSKGSITSETANWQLIADNNAPAPGLIFNDSYLLGIFSEADTGGHGVRGYRTYSLSAFQFASQASAPMELDHVWSAQPASPNVNAPNGDPILGPIRVYDTTNPDLTNQPFAATTAATAKIYSWAFTAAQQCTLFDPPGVSLIAAPTSLPSNYQTLFGAQRIQIMEYQGSANVAATSSYDFAPLQLTYKGITYIPEGIQVDEGAPDQHFIAGNPVAVGGYTIGILFKPQPPV
jgi:hypothetical protein